MTCRRGNSVKQYYLEVDPDNRAGYELAFALGEALYSRVISQEIVENLYRLASACINDEDPSLSTYYEEVANLIYSDLITRSNPYGKPYDYFSWKSQNTQMPKIIRLAVAVQGYLNQANARLLDKAA